MDRSMKPRTPVVPQLATGMFIGRPLNLFTTGGMKLKFGSDDIRIVEVWGWFVGWKLPAIPRHECGRRFELLLNLQYLWKYGIHTRNVYEMEYRLAENLHLSAKV